MQKLLTAFVGFILLSAPALADVRVPGTKVSYAIKRDAVTGNNASMVFIDATGDKTGKTYLAFVCDNGTPFARLYTRVTLGATGDEPATYFSASGGKPRSLDGRVREDAQTAKASVLDMTAFSTTQLLQSLLIDDNVAVRVEREGYSAVTYSFAGNGFKTAWKAVKECE